MDVVKQLSAELEQPLQAVGNVVTLLNEGNTIPFIARYRKEQHGAMSDELLRNLEKRLSYLRKLEERKGEVRIALSAQEKLTEALEEQLSRAVTLAEVEDLYRPYKQKRRTRASIARERGLEPLAARIWAQESSMESLAQLAQAYVNPALEINSSEEALSGAADILAEQVADDPDLRRRLRGVMNRYGVLVSRATGEEDGVYRLYYDFRRSLAQLQDHQILALNRGEREGLLKVQIELEPERAWAILEGTVLRRPNAETAAFLKAMVRDAYKRLLEPALHRELRGDLTERAQEGAIGLFALNLKALLMQPPVKGQVTMGLDPGYRNGCKVAVVDGTGKVLDTAVVYPTFGEKQGQEAVARLGALVKTHGVSHIAIGNGTASRETEQTVCELIRGLKNPPGYMVVNEAGASVYSASKLGAEEFPHMDVNLRSAVSIARRLQDPLAELVKIDPKSIGVGQYQHDMPQGQLDAALYGVVEDCVNSVGVDLNTASPALLGYVAGLNATTAQNIVRFREEHGAFQSRRQLLKVPKIGPKAFEQCAGFLRVPESKTVLDHTGVHPEAYGGVEILLTLCGYRLSDVSALSLGELPRRLKELGEEEAAARCGLGLPTLRDAVAELQKPGRDPRDELPPPQFRIDLLSIQDLRQGMELSGTVRNVTDFGAFVDVGVHQDGLVHISQISSRRISHPSQVLSVGQVVPVVVLEVDVAKKRISLSIKQAGQSHSG